MRIDLNSASMPELERSGRPSSANQNSAVSAEDSKRADDVASLSTGQDAIRTLSTKVSAVPDMRQELVASLQQAIRTGTYRISPDGIADKMIADRSH